MVLPRPLEAREALPLFWASQAAPPTCLTDLLHSFSHSICFLLIHAIVSIPSRAVTLPRFTAPVCTRVRAAHVSTLYRISLLHQVYPLSGLLLYVNAWLHTLRHACLSSTQFLQPGRRTRRSTFPAVSSTLAPRQPSLSLVRCSLPPTPLSPSLHPLPPQPLSA